MARRALGPATLQAVQAVQAALLPTDSSLLVACSGGADSLALAAAAQHVAQTLQRPVAALVVDHGLQAGSARTASRAGEQLAQLGYLDVRVATVEVDLTTGVGVEAAAREARYRALGEEAERRSATVLLGHTLDDQAETVLLGLARGSGTRSLSGMASRAGCYVRPLLSLRRASTERVCVELGLEPWRDPHNADDRYARARVRSRVLPLLEAELGPGVTEALARTAELTRLDADLLDQLADRLHPPDDTLDCSVLADAPAALRRRVIRVWLGARGATAVGYAHVLAVEELVTGWNGQQGVDVPGLRVVRAEGRLLSE